MSAQHSRESRVGIASAGMPTQCVLLRLPMSKVLARASDVEGFRRSICLSQVFARGTFLFSRSSDKRESLSRRMFVCMPTHVLCACKQAFLAIKKNKFNLRKISWTFHELFSFHLQAVHFQLIRLQLIRLNV
ncbi:MAG: hypothetical protein EPN75_12795 [Beijerinckiaceae bacterium]|nr:MAG: hypothetical protein EPN75_12795 [Beijerinckiaceae bacterium]